MNSCQKYGSKTNTIINNVNYDLKANYRMFKMDSDILKRYEHQHHSYGRKCAHLKIETDFQMFFDDLAFLKLELTGVFLGFLR